MEDEKLEEIVVPVPFVDCSLKYKAQNLDKNIFYDEYGLSCAKDF